MMKRLGPVLAMLFAIMHAHYVYSAPNIKPGKVELYPTWSAVGIELPYTGDDNENAQASFVWQRDGEKEWHNGVDMTIDRHRRLIWASIWPLHQGDKVHIDITVHDPDSVNTRIKVSTTVKRMNLDWSGFREYHVSPNGSDRGPGTKQQPFRTLTHASRIAKSGTVVYAQSGTYAEADLFAGLKGTDGKPIVFSAAPGQTPIIDSSLKLAKGHTWKDIGKGVFVAEVAFDGGYVAQDELRCFRYPSLAELQNDKLKVRRAWYYDSDRKRLYVRTGTTSPASDHIYHVSQHPYGIHLTRSQHVVVRGFTIRHAGAALVRVSEGTQGCILLENKLNNGPGGIFIKSETTRDNAIWRNEIHEPGMEDISWAANYAHGYPNQAIYCDRAGRGNSFCYNRIYNHFDLIAVESWKNPNALRYNRDCDILFNDLWHSGDDAIEVDGGGVNMRIHGNKIRGCFTAISLAPIERGPVYVTRNTISFFNLLFKFNVAGCTSLGWTYIYHNTGYCLLAGADGGTGFSFPTTIPSSNKVLKNNIVITNEWSIRSGKKGYEVDSNCYFNVPRKPPRRFQWDRKVYATIKDFRKGTGQEKYGLYADPLLKNIADVGKIPSRDLLERTPKQYRQAVRLEGGFELKDGSPCIDAAVRIRGINDAFSGKGPDIGALERK